MLCSMYTWEKLDVNYLYLMCCLELTCVRLFRQELISWSLKAQLALANTVRMVETARLTVRKISLNVSVPKATLVLDARSDWLLLRALVTHVSMVHALRPRTTLVAMHAPAHQAGLVETVTSVWSAPLTLNASQIIQFQSSFPTWITNVFANVSMDLKATTAVSITMTVRI